MRKFLMLPLAGLLVIGGATAVLAAPGAVTDTARQAYSAATTAGSLLGDVLADLVSDGVIDQAQSDAIVEAVDSRIEEKRTEMAEIRELIAGFLEDGIISADELAQLPEDHPWRNLDELLADGQLTVDELRQLGGPLAGRGGHGPRGFGPGHGGPGGFWGPVGGEDAPADDPNTDGSGTDAGSDSNS